MTHKAIVGKKEGKYLSSLENQTFTNNPKEAQVFESEKLFREEMAARSFSTKGFCCVRAKSLGLLKSNFLVQQIVGDHVGCYISKENNQIYLTNKKEQAKGFSSKNSANTFIEKFLPSMAAKYIVVSINEED